jgi:hypothetical protein
MANVPRNVNKEQVKKLPRSQQPAIGRNYEFFFYLDYETIDTAATPGLLCQPRVIMKMIVESMMECILAGENEVLGGNLPQRHFCPSQNPTCPPGFEPGPPRWEAGD